MVLLFPFKQTVAQNNDQTYKVDKVVIDAGHGGKDSGAIGKRTKEKDIALSIALKLGNYIRDYVKGVEVIYTRDDDSFVDLYKRGDIANKVHADLFISIHANWFKNSNIKGTETFVLGASRSNANLEVAKKENSVITLEDDYSTKYEGFDPNSTESYIIFELIQNTHLEQSLEFASKVQNQFRERVSRVDRGVKQDGFIVLWKTTMPSVLIETGFISNSKEEIFLNSETGQDYIASAIFRAFREYKNNIEKKSNFSHIESEPQLRFRVQVLSSKKPVKADAPNFREYKDVKEFRSGKWYKYTIGGTGSYQEALKLQDELRKEFKGAFVIAVRGNEIIPLSEAREIQAE